MALAYLTWLRSRLKALKAAAKRRIRAHFASAAAVDEAVAVAVGDDHSHQPTQHNADGAKLAAKHRLATRTLPSGDKVGIHSQLMRVVGPRGPKLRLVYDTVRPGPSMNRTVLERLLQREPRDLTGPEIVEKLATIRRQGGRIIKIEEDDKKEEGRPGTSWGRGDRNKRRTRWQSLKHVWTWKSRPSPLRSSWTSEGGDTVAPTAVLICCETTEEELETGQPKPGKETQQAMTFKEPPETHDQK